MSRFYYLIGLRTCCLILSPWWMSHSCRYVVSSLEMLVAEDYLIIYMNGATPRSKMPGISWLKKCYQMIDRRWEREELWTHCALYKQLFCTDFFFSAAEYFVLSLTFLMSCAWLWWQTEEESEVFGHCSSHMVHTHCPGHIQALYQVRYRI